MEEFNLNDYINVIYLKHQLVSVSIDTLIELYNDQTNFINFLNTLYVLAETDSAFLLLSEETVNKIYTIVGDNRFKYEDSDIKDAIENIISYLNESNGYSEGLKNLLKSNYMVYQEEVRQQKFKNPEDLMNSIAADAFVHNALSINKLESLDQVEDKYFFASINYFLETMPILFENEEFRNRTITTAINISRKYRVNKRKEKKLAISTINKIKGE